MEWKNQKGLKRMRPYCDPGVSTASDWEQRNATDLILEGRCPSWVLASTPVLGRCMPGAPSTEENTVSDGVNPRILYKVGARNVGTTSAAKDIGNMI